VNEPATPRTIDDAPAHARAIPDAADPPVPVAGLSTREAAVRRAAGLGNAAAPSTSRTYREIVSDNLFTFINLSIIALGVLLAVVGQPIDALLSGGAIAVNALVSIVQEVRAKRILDRIALLDRPLAAVLRDGQSRSLPPDELVVGDLLLLSAGDQIVVDGRVLPGGPLGIDESALTGESAVVAKRAGQEIYSGSFCVRGRGSYVAERVGSASFANQLMAGARARRRVVTPLQRATNLLIRILLLLIVYFEFLLLMEAVIKQRGFAITVENLALLAGLIPNGLLVSIALAYALGAIRVSRTGVLIQQSNAIESLSNVDVLCMDKTGTLTTNRLQVAQLDPIGMALPRAQYLLGTMVASMASGNATSAAIATAFPQEAVRPVAEVPFSSSYKWSALVWDRAELRGTYVLGALEMLRPALVGERGDQAAAWSALVGQAQVLADHGLRTLLFAATPAVAAAEADPEHPALPTGLVPLGLVSLRDELRPGVGAALAAFIAAGVQPKIISGDAPETVAALVKQAGLSLAGPPVSGLALARMDDNQLSAAVATGTVFGRISPQQKEQLIRALRARGHYVAMIGDGVNDVLSLKRANLGIAMQSGSQATRGVANIVLTKDSFAALVPAVREGQRIVNGMHAIILLFLVRILTLALVALSSLVIGDFPLALRHAALGALLVVGIPSIFLALWARPGPPAKGDFAQQLGQFIFPPVLLGSAIGVLLYWGLLLIPLTQHGLFDINTVANDEIDAFLTGRRPVAQTALTAFFICSGLLMLIFVAPPSPWWAGGAPLRGDRRPLWLALGLLGAFAAVILLPPTRQFYGLVLLGWRELGVVTVALVIWLVLVRWFWRGRIIQRFIGLTTAETGEATTKPRRPFGRLRAWLQAHKSRTG